MNVDIREACSSVADSRIPVAPTGGRVYLKAQETSRPGRSSRPWPWGNNRAAVWTLLRHFASL